MKRTFRRMCCLVVVTVFLVLVSLPSHQRKSQFLEINLVCLHCKDKACDSISFMHLNTSVNFVSNPRVSDLLELPLAVDLSTPPLPCSS